MKTFRTALIHFIRLVIEKIELSEQTIDEHRDLNYLFNDFLDLLNDNTIRFYTTNYDRIPAKIKPNYFFEGFGRELEIKEEHTFLDTEKITSDINEPCYYNLHGSIHYNYDGAGWLLNAEKAYYQRELFQKEINQLGEIHLPSNIITGMGKASRILFGPHLSFYNSFYNDCMRTDNLIIIGYSFSDVHINQAIKQTILNNETEGKLCVVIVDCFKSNEKFLRFREKLFDDFKLCFDSSWHKNMLWVEPTPNHLPYYLFSAGLNVFLKEYTKNPIINNAKR